MQILAGCTHQLVDGFDHVHRNADGARLIGNAAGNRLPDPPGRIGAELVAAPIFKLVHRLHQADIALLDQIQKLQASVGVFLGNGNHEAQIRLHHFLFRNAGFAFALLHHVGNPAIFAQINAGFAGNAGKLGANPVYIGDFSGGKGRPFLVAASIRSQPAFIQLAANIGFQKILPVQLVPVGQLQHLAAQRHQPTVIAV